MCVWPQVFIRLRQTSLNQAISPYSEPPHSRGSKRGPILTSRFGDYEGKEEKVPELPECCLRAKAVALTGWLSFRCAGHKLSLQV